MFPLRGKMNNSHKPGEINKTFQGLHTNLNALILSSVN